MARGRKPKHKDPFEELPPEWRSSVDLGSEDEIKEKLAQTAIESQAIVDQMASDTAFQEAKLAYKFAGEGYRDRKKMVKLKQKYATQTLASRGRL